MMSLLTPNLLSQVHSHIAQHDRPRAQRSATAINYDSAISGLLRYMQSRGEIVPTRKVIEQWRDAMVTQGLAPKTVNAKLSAIRKLLNAIADETTDIQAKLVIRDWSHVDGVRLENVTDKLHEDYGTRLEIDEAQAYLAQFGASLKERRDGALVALMMGAGLRVSEACAVTYEDAYHVTLAPNMHGIRIRHGKGNKTRVAVVGGLSHWVYQMLDEYLSIAPIQEGVLIRRIVRLPSGVRVSSHHGMTPHAVHEALQAYKARNGTLALAPHDLRRTYAYLCRKHGMAWEALRDNLGHTSIKITEGYVGSEKDWNARSNPWNILTE